MAEYTYKYPMQTVTADMVVMHGDSVLLIKRNTEPFKDSWALAGGHLDPEDESTIDTAYRELKEETGIDLRTPEVADKVLDSRFVGSYSTAGRDPRGRYVSNVYYVVLDSEKDRPEFRRCAKEVQQIKWMKLEDLTSDMLAFDHFDMLKDAFHAYVKEVCFNQFSQTHSYVSQIGHLIVKLEKEPS